MLTRWGAILRLFALAFDWIPGVSLYRRPADATFLFNIALALAAGFLLHRYIEEGQPKPFRTLPKWLAFALAGATTLALAVLTGTGLAFSLREEPLTSSLAALAVAAALAASGAAVLFGLQARPRRALAASLFVLLSGTEILWRNAASPLNAEPLESYAVYAGMKPSEAAGIEILRHEIAAKMRDGDRPRVEILGLKGRGRMHRWFSNSKIRSAIIRCASMITNVQSALEPVPRYCFTRHYPGHFSRIQ